MTEIPQHHMPQPIRPGDNQAFAVGGAPGWVALQVFDHTGTRVIWFTPEEASILVRQVKEAMHHARSGLIVPDGSLLPDLNGQGG